MVSAEFPPSNWNAPGGPTLSDIARQAGDVRFLIDSLLAGIPELSLPAPLDPERIAAIGLSLGGLTATLVAFHPELRDARVRAVIPGYEDHRRIRPRRSRQVPVHEVRPPVARSSSRSR